MGVLGRLQQDNHCRVSWWRLPISTTQTLIILKKNCPALCGLFCFPSLSSCLPVLTLSSLAVWFVAGRSARFTYFLSSVSSSILLSMSSSLLSYPVLYTNCCSIFSHCSPP